MFKHVKCVFQNSINTDTNIIFGRFYIAVVSVSFLRGLSKIIIRFVSIYVYYVAVRVIVLSRHGSKLARPVIIYDIIHSLMCMPSSPHCGFSGVSPDGNRIENVLLRPTRSQSDEPSDLRGSLSPTTRQRCTMS